MKNGEHMNALEAIQSIKDLVCGEAKPNWHTMSATTATRVLIADICDRALNYPCFQTRASMCVRKKFGNELAHDRLELTYRFLEEALKLSQACGCTRESVHGLVDYVYDKQEGHRNKELGATMLALAALCTALNLDMKTAGELELKRVHFLTKEIKAQKTKGPLPDPDDAEHSEMCRALRIYDPSDWVCICKEKGIPD